MTRVPVRGLLIVAVVVAAIVLVARRGSDDAPPVSHNHFASQLAAGSVARIDVRGSRLVVIEADETTEPYTLFLPSPPTSADLSAWSSAGATVRVSPEGGSWSGALFVLLPLALVAGVLFVMFRSGRFRGGGGAGFGKSRAKLATETNTHTLFGDVAGVEEAKRDLTEIVGFLRNPETYHALGARIPHGVLMVGPPGSGKTHLAKAVAGEAGVPFFSISGSDFVEMFVGVGAARVRDLFETAKKSAPCIVFIDEIDAVGRRRGAGSHGGNDEREQTLNALLVEMDGFESEHDIIIVAATNRPDVLDPALLRPGRFDRQVVVDAPDLRGREAILRIHARGKPLADDVDLARVAQRTPGFVGADLENLLNEAALVAARAGRSSIAPRDLEHAADRVVMGPERRSRVISEREKRLTAYHEAGHALAAHLLEFAEPVHKITIVPRGRALGFVMQFPEEDRVSITERELRDRIGVALAGRIAEEEVFEDVTTGAQNDFQQATEIARRMVTQWGMSGRLGRVALVASSGSFLGGDAEGPRTYSESTARLVDDEVRAILDTEYARVAALLRAHRADLERIVDVLIERETLHAGEFDALMRGQPLPPVPDPLPRPAPVAAPSPAPARTPSEPATEPRLPSDIVPEAG